MDVLVKNLACMRKGAAAMLIAFGSLAPVIAGGAVEEIYEFRFEVKNSTDKKNFIVLLLPSDVRKIDVAYKDIPNPILAFSYIAEDKSEMTALQSQVNVTYFENQTKINFISPGEKYRCIVTHNGRFDGGACLRSARLFLPLNLIVTIYQNNLAVYSRADLFEIKKKQYPHLVKDDPVTAKGMQKEREAKLKELNAMFKKGLITKEEYAEKKRNLLDGL